MQESQDAEFQHVFAFRAMAPPPGEHETFCTIIAKNPAYGNSEARVGIEHTDASVSRAKIASLLGLARPSQFEGLTGAKPFRISEGYPRVFTTEKGGRRPILAGSGRP